MKKKRISKEEIDQCINLLHTDYIGCPIYIFHSFWDYVKWSFKHFNFDFDQLKKAKNGMSTGMYNSTENFIQIYVFNHLGGERYLKLNVIHTLYHELRHYYQFTYKAKIWNNNKLVKYDLGHPKYREAPIERDANKFAQRMMEKNRKEVSRILNVYPDWDFTR